MEQQDTGVIEEAAALPEVAEPQSQPTEKEINFRRMAESLEELKKHNQMLQHQLMQQQPPQRKEEEFDINRFSDDDIPTYGELKRLRQQEARERNMYLEAVKNLEMKTQYSDYDKVIKQFLPDVLQDDPDLAAAIKDSPQMHKLAYRLAQSSPKYHQERLAAQNQSAVDRIMENTTRPQPANARKNVSYQSEEARIASMSDEEIMNAFNMAKARS